MLFAIDWDVGGNVLGFIIGVIIRLYDLVASLIALIFAIASTDIFKEEMINEITSRVYIVLAVFMLFRITISCIQFLISPDKMDDKEAGFGAIVKRTAISVALLALVPTIFAFAKDAQNYIISEIPTIILGKNSTGDYDLSKFKGQEGLAYEIGYNTFISFLEYKSGEGCNDGSVAGLNGVTKEQAQNSGANVIITDLESAHEWRFYLAGEKSASKEDNKNCKMPDKKGALKGTSKFKFNTILALLGGLFLVYCLVCMVIDVGIRCLKWAVLQIVAPIPIATYIDPKTSKKSFDAWKKNCFDVYCSLFINLIIIYLILWVFQKALLNSTFFESDPEMGAYGVLVKVTLIIALFFFAKKAPKFLCDILGIKEGSGSFKEMFGRVGGTAPLGIGLAGISAFRGNYRNQNHGKNFTGDTVGQRLKHGLASKDAWGNRLKGIASGLAGATSANANAIKHIAKGESKGMKETMRYGRDHAMQARVNRTVDKLNGLSGPSGWAQRHEAKLDQTYQVKTEAELAEFKLKANEAIHKNVGAYKKAVLGRIEKEDSMISITRSGCNDTMELMARTFMSNETAIRNAVSSGKLDANSRLVQTFNASYTALNDAAVQNLDTQISAARAANDSELEKRLMKDRSKKINEVMTNYLSSNGINMTYAAMTGLSKDADTVPDLGEIAQTFGTSGSVTLMAQKEIFKAGMKGQVVDTAGNMIADINAYDSAGKSNAQAHVDIQNAVGAMEQDITQHAADLSKIKIDGFNGGTEFTSADMYKRAFKENFSGLDDAVEKESARIQRANADEQAKRQAANESLKRRQANKDKK